ncbi:MAG: inorganic pyrophosphatase [Candidatus Levybacteria bacterium RIFCSPLOWO2_01_FULL_38_21]|nr:MAG: inorganic pyrophosphatase [Candidatus Levybacteria bacterium RIFCSPLOWO2_01_FULL_38_21]
MDIKKLSIGKNPPEEINVFIEIPAGVSVKYEIDKDSGIIFVDRFLYTEMEYPFNYGFIPNTLADDGDPVDVLVLSSKPVVPGVVIPSRPIGMLEMEDEAGIDNKVIAVPMGKIDLRFKDYNDVLDIPKDIKEKIKYFFENYKKTEPGKWVKIRDWRGKKEALGEIRKSIK